MLWIRSSSRLNSPSSNLSHRWQIFACRSVFFCDESWTLSNSLLVGMLFLNIPLLYIRLETVYIKEDGSCHTEHSICWYSRSKSLFVRTKRWYAHMFRGLQTEDRNKVLSTYSKSFLSFSSAPKRSIGFFMSLNTSTISLCLRNGRLNSLFINLYFVGPFRPLDFGPGPKRWGRNGL